MRSLVKIGLLIPMVALLAFGVALADTAKDQTELNSELNGDLDGSARADADQGTARAAGDAPSTRAKGDVFGERRSIAGRRANTGRAELGNTADNRRWWSNDSQLSDKDDEDESSDSDSRDSSDEDDEETASPGGFGDDSSSS